MNAIMKDFLHYTVFTAVDSINLFKDNFSSEDLSSQMVPHEASLEQSISLKI